MSTVLVSMVALAAVCWVFRILFIVLVPASALPDRVRETLGYLPPAVLAALVAVETDGAMRGSGLLVAALVLVSVLAAGLVVRLTGSLLLAVGTGLVAALLIDLLLLA